VDRGTPGAVTGEHTPPTEAAGVPGEEAATTSLIRRIAVDTRPLRHVDFRRLWIGQGVSFIGYQLTAVAVPVQVYAITHSSFWVGMLGVAGLVPLIVFGLWGGSVADLVLHRWAADPGIARPA
jgi:Transmembrane secretion effector